MTENEKINEVIKDFANGDMNINAFVNKIYRLGFEYGKKLERENASNKNESLL